MALRAYISSACVTIVASLAISIEAHATITIYSSQAAFDAAFPGAQVINFASLTPTMGSYTEFPGATTSLDGDTFVGNQTLFALAQSFNENYGATFLSSQSAGATPADLTIDAPGAMAIGFDYGSYGTFPLGVTATLSTGDQFTIPDADDTAQFVGFSSSGTPIHSITMSGLYADGEGPGTVIDLVDVSQVPSPAPEPTAWGLMVLGLGVLGAGLRNSRRNSATPPSDNSRGAAMV